MRITSTIALLTLAAIASDPAQDTQYFRYQRQVILPAQTTGQTCLAVPPDLFTHSSPSLGDVRIYRSGLEVPWAMHLAYPLEPGLRHLQPINLGQTNLGQTNLGQTNLGQTDGSTVFDVKMPATFLEGKYSDVELSIDAKDFLATVEVSGSSADGPATKLGSFTIFDLTQQKLGRSTVLHLPESDFPTLHFRVIGPLPPSTITDISVDRPSQNQPRYITVATSTQVQQIPYKTLIKFTVPANIGVSRVVFVPGKMPASFSRDVQVTATAIAASDPGFREPPYPLSSTENILRIHREENGHRMDEERLSLDTDGSSSTLARNWIITIENGDDAPISLQSVRLEMIERQVCFEATAADGYTLFYGDPGRKTPAYDYQRIFRPTGHPAESVLGPEQANTQFQPRPDGRPFSEKHPALLWTTLIAVVTLLAGIALRTAKRTDAANG